MSTCKNFYHEGFSVGVRWFAVHTLPHRVEGAAAQLRNQHFEIFLPRIRRTRRHARKLETVLAPLFPRYLFIRLDLSRDAWRSVNGTYGVARLVMQHDRPLPVFPGVVERLVALADAQGCVHFDRSSDLRPGQRVLIEEGSFARYFGIIEQLDGKGRAALLLDLLGGQVRMHLPVTAVRPVI